ncbi:MAG: CoA-binding protein [Deltaproteobacteria bacterium]|nr:CoA-binding protein [Deltaproteobacteria bacterium]
MSSRNQRFFELKTYAIVANTDLGPFPILLVDELQDLGKTVYPIDLGGSRYVSGDEAFPSLLEAPPGIEAVIIALPRHRVGQVVEELPELHIRELWIQGGISLQTLARCEELGVEVHEADAHVYTRPGFSFGKLLLKISGKY